MKTRLYSLKDCGIEPFNFAGFSFPKYVWTLPKGDYYHAPTPNNRSNGAAFFYLDSDGMPDLRWKWCDEIDGCRIDHTGWYTDEYGDSETIRGIVMRLPNGRGFLAGWSMGNNMASEIDYHVYEDEIDAAYAADSMAEQTAERQREYCEEEENNEENEA